MNRTKLRSRITEALAEYPEKRAPYEELAHRFSNEEASHFWFTMWNLHEEQIVAIDEDLDVTLSSLY